MEKRVQIYQDNYNNGARQWHKWTDAEEQQEQQELHTIRRQKHI